MKYDKQALLEGLRKHIEYIRGKVASEREAVKIRANKSLREIGAMQPSDQLVYMQLKAYAVDRMEQLEQLDKTPYFTKCEVVEKDTGEKKNYFFSKHQMSEESIYSWVAPVAVLRFESPGEIEYAPPNGAARKMTLVGKEQYMIVDGKVFFFAKEGLDIPRELVYQENFTIEKQGFMLPEIVAQMEKAQDKVIRAHHAGPLVISGPAGSGKTTLALHRVAYLTQAPDTGALYPAESIIVFVQDNGTKEYFSQLLPGLGIHNVTITTFSEWARMILGLEEYAYTVRYGETEEEKDSYEYRKIQALRSAMSSAGSDAFTMLSHAYGKHFSNQDKKLLMRQKSEKVLDRFDLTLLLRARLEKQGTFEIKKEYAAIVKGVRRKKIRKTAINYSLAIVDEFQNYLPEQLAILKACLDAKTGSVVYVGDLAQQIYLGTIRNWEDAGEEISPERNIRLDKVYRNTKNILAFIQSLGYSIDIPQGLKDGPAVIAAIAASQAEEIEHIRKAALGYESGTIGILAKDEAYLEAFKEEFRDRNNIHVLTMSESQGVEFSLVCLVGINAKTFLVAEHSGALPEHIEERKRMQKDLLYVALTRAITELHVYGTEKISAILGIQ